MIIFASFETEFSAHGGLGAVMKLLPKEVGKDECAIIAPLFRKFMDPGQLVASGAGASEKTLLDYHVLVRGQAHRVEVVEILSASGVRHFFLSTNDFFTAPTNPYTNPCDPTRPIDPYRNPNNGEILIEDALFFSIAVPVALAELAKGGWIRDRDITLHLQDWETAAIAAAVRKVNLKPALQSIRCVLTIHNPYDQPLHAMNSMNVCDLATSLGFKNGHSILEQVIPLLDAPLSTVSDAFASELRNEPLYTQIFCPHLQPVFKTRGLVGIDNGIFGTGNFPFSSDALSRAKKGDYHLIAEEKAGFRNQLTNLMEKLPEDPAGQTLDLTKPELPLFFFLGRDDPRQKGFDVMVEAIRSIDPGKARYLFAIMPGDEGSDGLGFIRELAAERPGEVFLIAGRMEKSTFDQLRLGCSYLVMGSLYEPFGAANEGYIAGMPVIARATGGLLQQVTPMLECLINEDILGLYGRQMIRRYHGPAEKPTGILFREEVSFADEVDGWKAIIACGYLNGNPRADRLEERSEILLFKEMAASAAAALELAIVTFGDKDKYAAMIYHGWRLLEKFSWKRAVSSYRQHLYQ